MIERLAIYLARKVRITGPRTRREVAQLLSGGNPSPATVTEVLRYAEAEGWLAVDQALDRISPGDAYPEWTLERDTSIGRLYSPSRTMGHELHSSGGGEH